MKTPNGKTLKNEPCTDSSASAVELDEPIKYARISDELCIKASSILQQFYKILFVQKYNEGSNIVKYY